MNIKQTLPFLVLLFSFVSTQKEPFTQTGTASYYADKFQGRPTSSGEKYDRKLLTAAHKTLPFGTILLVTNLKNDSTVLVKVNDRIGTNKRIIDLSRAAANQLNFIREGLVKVKIEEILSGQKVSEPSIDKEVAIDPTTTLVPQDGVSLMNQHCIRCHEQKEITAYSADQWKKILPNMAKKAKITYDEKEKLRLHIEVILSQEEGN